MHLHNRFLPVGDWLWFLVWGVASSVWCLTAAQQLGATFDEPVYVERGRIMYWRMMQSGTDLVRYRSGVLIVEKLAFYRMFSGTAMACFACFPIAMTAFMVDWNKPLQSLRDQLDFLGLVLPASCLFAIMGIALFLPVAVSYRLTVNLTQKWWTVERGFWRWQEKQEGTAGDFARVMWVDGSQSDSTSTAWLVWTEKRRGSVALMLRDSPTLTTRALAQEVATALGLPLTDWKRNAIT